MSAPDAPPAITSTHRVFIVDRGERMRRSRAAAWAALVLLVIALGMAALAAGVRL